MTEAKRTKEPHSEARILELEAQLLDAQRERDVAMAVANERGAELLRLRQALLRAHS